MSTWLALYAEHGRALVARDALAAAGYEHFCPVEQLTRRRKIANRNKYKLEKVVAPIFGRYLFACGEWAELRSIRGVNAVIRAGQEIWQVPAAVVATMLVRAPWQAGVGHVVGSRSSVVANGPSFAGKPGDRFKFTSGGFAGLGGTIHSTDALSSKGIISAYIEMLGGTRLVSVPHDIVETLAAA